MRGFLLTVQGVRMVFAVSVSVITAELRGTCSLSILLFLTEYVHSSCKCILNFSVNSLFLSPNSFILESGSGEDR